MDNQGPIFTFTDPISNDKQNKNNTVVDLKPLKYRESPKEFQKRHKENMNVLRVMFGLPKPKNQVKKKRGFQKNWGQKTWRKKGA